MSQANKQLVRWKARYSVISIVGIILNLLFALPLLLIPDLLLTAMKVPVPDQIIWTRFSGGLLILLSVFYVPSILDIDRFRIIGWLQFLPSRAFGMLFFLCAVLFFGAPGAFIFGTLIDGSIGILVLHCMIKITTIEQAIATGRVDP